MKKIISLILVILMMTAVFSGCSLLDRTVPEEGESESELMDNSAADSDTEKTESKTEGEDENSSERNPESETENNSENETESGNESNLESNPENENNSENETEDDFEDDSEVVTDPDIWDGSIATSFAGGNGSESSPYQIRTGAQLAFLAKQVNSGNTYANKYFILTNNIDLNNIEWIPIGDGVNYFAGIFDGKEHFIKNLKITQGAYYITPNTRDDYVEIHKKAYVAGLFGVCIDAKLQNVNIDNSEIVIGKTIDRNEIVAGALVGKIYGENSAELSNIKVSNVSIKVDHQQKGMIPGILSLGGVVGYLRGGESSTCEISRLQADAKITISNNSGAQDDVGGLIGKIYLKRSCVISNCASYLTHERYNNHGREEDTCGAIGSLCAKQNAKLTNVFSKITYNAYPKDDYEFYIYPATAIVGLVVGRNSSFEFTNLFGYVVQTNKTREETKNIMKLYELYETVSPDIVSETNCKGCTELPENHGFDSEIWDLSDLSHPVLK